MRRINTERIFVLIMVLTLLIPLAVTADPVKVKLFGTLVYDDLDDGSREPTILIGDTLYMPTSSELIMIDVKDWSKKSFTLWEKYKKDGYNYGMKGYLGNKIIVDADRRGDYKLLLIDPRTGKTTPFSDKLGYMEGLNENYYAGVDTIHEYLGGKFFLNDCPAQEWGGGDISYLYDPSTDKTVKYEQFLLVYDMSPSGMQLLGFDTTDTYIKNDITSEKYRIDSGFGTAMNRWPVVYFYSEDLVLYSIQEDGHIIDRNGNRPVQFEYCDENGEPIDYKTKIRDSHYFYSGKKLYYFPGEDQVLRDMGLLFEPRTATVNDDRVRVRDLARLDYGVHRGFLNTGDRVDVLDRSGVKQTIGEMDAYWYKVRRPSDGLEGWTYGWFLDLDDPLPRETTPDEEKRYQIVNQ